METSVGDRLREVREKQGLRQKDVSSALSIAANVISRYETGERTPDPSTLARFAKYYGVSTDYLLGLSDALHDAKELNKSPRNKARSLTSLGDLIEVPIYQLNKIGEDIYQENIVDWQYVSAQQVGNKNVIGFQAVDDSMIGSGIKVGSDIIVASQASAESGQVVVVETKGLKMVRRINYVNDGAILSAENSKYQPEYVKNGEFRIIGIVIKVVSDVK